MEKSNNIKKFIVLSYINRNQVQKLRKNVEGFTPKFWLNCFFPSYCQWHGKFTLAFPESRSFQELIAIFYYFSLLMASWKQGKCSETPYGCFFSTSLPFLLLNKNKLYVLFCCKCMVLYNRQQGTGRVLYTPCLIHGKDMC